MSTATARAYQPYFAGRFAPFEMRKSPQNKAFYGHRDTYLGKAHCIKDRVLLEPAMGSAAFLNEAINQLAEAYISKKEQETGEIIGYENRFKELQKVKMFIADRNVYGIDLNPVAVELAEVSLWLNTIFEGGFVPWFGTQLVNGNSLIGARRQVYPESALSTTSQGLCWYENAPERVPLGTERKKKKGYSQIYHFLLGDPGMCSYGDKVIKSLEPENIKRMKDWNKKFTAPYSADDLVTLQRLSDVIDELWKAQIDLRKEVGEKTQDSLSVFGYTDEAEDSHTTIRQKDKIFSELYKSEHMRNAGPYARLKFAMDYWCALWFWPIDKADLLPTRSEFLFDMSLILEGTTDSVVVTNVATDKKQTRGQLSLFPTEMQQLELDIMALYEGMGEVDIPALRKQNPRLDLAARIAEQNKFMHWELEFADQFAERGGFDLIVGNPPWVKVEWKAVNIASETNPLIAIRKDGEKNFIGEFFDRHLDMACEEYVQLAGQLAYMLSASNYPDLKKQQGNIYKCFVVNALQYLGQHGAYGLIHPEGLYDNPYGEDFRTKLYKHLRYHFEFINEKYLFHDIAHTKRFSINIAAKDQSDSFITITNLFDTKTIEDSFSDEHKYPLMGLKDNNNEWNVFGHPDRIIKVDKKVLNVFGRVFDGKESRGARMPEVHAKICVTLFEKMLKTKTTIGDLPGFFCSQLMNETAAIKNKLIEVSKSYPTSMSEEVYSGPNIWLANPFFKAARILCVEKSDYDLVNLDDVNLGKSLSRTKYKTTSKCFAELPKLDSGIRYDSPYKIFARRRLNLSMERTLISAIVPQNTVQIHAVLGIYVQNPVDLVAVAACLNTVVYDFYIKTYGKEDLYDNTLSKLPIPIDKDMSLALARVLALNAIGPEFGQLWKTVWSPEFTKNEWSKEDVRLPKDFFSTSEEWKPDYIATTDYMRRQLFVELDVCVAMLLGLSLQDLISIYSLQFPVMQQYEMDTWYDATGKIVFTNNKGLTSVGYSRAEWENEIKDAPAGKRFYKTVTDDTVDGPVERIIEYVAPFDRCDREKDYETAWKFFEKKYGKGVEK